MFVIQTRALIAITLGASLAGACGEPPPPYVLDPLVAPQVDGGAHVREVMLVLDLSASMFNFIPGLREGCIDGVHRLRSEQLRDGDALGVTLFRGTTTPEPWIGLSALFGASGDEIEERLAYIEGCPCDEDGCEVPPGDPWSVDCESLGRLTVPAEAMDRAMTELIEGRPLAFKAIAVITDGALTAGAFGDAADVADLAAAEGIGVFTASVSFTDPHLARGGGFHRYLSSELEAAAFVLDVYGAAAD